MTLFSFFFFLYPRWFLLRFLRQLTCVSARPVDRSGPTVVRSHQCRHHAVQADHRWRGRVLELSGRAWCSGRAFHPARLLQEEAGVEPRRPGQPISSVRSAQEHATIALVALPPSYVQPMVDEFLAPCVISQSEMANIFWGGWFWMLKYESGTRCLSVPSGKVCQKLLFFFNLRCVFII